MEVPAVIGFSAVLVIGMVLGVSGDTGPVLRADRVEWRATSDVGPSRRLASASPGSDTLIARDDGIHAIYALGGTLLYRAGQKPADGISQLRWMRVVNGRRLTVHGMPANADPVSIGRDVSGRIVAVVDQHDLAGDSTGWWLYDIARDAARPLRAPKRAGCVVEAVAVWRSRMAYQERCDGLLRARIVVRVAGRTIHRITAGGAYPRIVLRSRSLAVLGDVSGQGDPSLWRILDRGRRCRKVVAQTVEESEMWFGLGAGALTWAIADLEFDGLNYSRLEVQRTVFAGRCGGTVRRIPDSRLPGGLIQAVAIDGHLLYYATATGIYRLRLPPI